MKWSNDLLGMIDVVWKIFWPWNGRMISYGKYFDHEMVEWFHTTSALQWDLATESLGGDDLYDIPAIL